MNIVLACADRHAATPQHSLASSRRLASRGASSAARDLLATSMLRQITSGLHNRGSQA
jgi:hypothetical protein